uniref:Photosystem I assembly protein Ycf4 n=1 Tax=Cyanothece sp. (strain PCC 7425 / ATCC 29141) TaxID=395961 RepID=YCF4_CYAP4|nr:RecName: Full=Photosystem I assembly protein Ycf4 [Cyanothece sp. PCC 7425]
MTSPTVSTDRPVLRYEVLGSRRFSNYWWATVITIGGTGFFLAGLSSYLHVNLLPIGNPVELFFIPQGIAIGFYGVAALLLAIYLWATIGWNVGGGYNEFNKETGIVRIFRWGFPGKNRQVEISARIPDVQAVRIVIREGVNPKRTIYLRLKGRGDIPLTRVGQPIPLTDLENQAAEIASFLGVAIEGL